MALIGSTFLAAAFPHRWIGMPILLGAVGVAALGWRLEANKSPCIACGSMIPEAEAADLRRCIYVRSDELEKLTKRELPQ